MSDRFCDTNEAMAALTYLRHAFGGYAIPEQEERAHLRLFRTCTPADLREAIDDLVRKAERRPSPNDVAQLVKARAMDRRNREDQARREAERVEVDSPPEVASQRIAEIKESLAKERIRG